MQLRQTARVLMGTLGAAAILATMAQASVVSRGVLFGTGTVAVAVSEVAADMSAAISAAVIVAAAGATACETHSCASPLLALIHSHPIIGRVVAEHEMNVYLAKHPDAEDPLSVVANQAGLPPPTTRRVDRDGQPISRSVPLPPGDCSEDQQKRLQDDVNDKCKINSPGRCVRSDNTAVLQSKMEGNRLCFLARTKINTTCFRGGDLGHRIATLAARNSLTRCEELLRSLGAP